MCVINKDLTIGKPYTVVWKFCLPLFGSIIFQQLYNLADSFVAGKFIGNDALAAVGNSYEITLIFIAFAFGCNIGCSVITSQLFGAKRFRDMKTAVYTTLISGGVLCVLLMTLGLIFSTKLLELINTPENIFADSKLYLLIYIIGLPFVFYYNISSGIFSALGDSKTPFIFLACSSVSNIAADILFVAGFKMGGSGGAWATFICQGVSCILAVFFVFRRFAKIETDGKPAAFSFALLKRIAAVAIPSILQQSFISVGNIIIQGVINSFGSGVIAGYSASIKLNNLVIPSFTTFYFFAAAKLVSDGVLRGAGQMKAFMTGTFTDLILRVVLAIILSKTALASTGIWVSWPVGWCVAGVISLTFCFKYMNMVKYDGIV